MKFAGYIILCLSIYLINPLAAFCQQNKQEPVGDIFGDLPINDPATLSQLGANETGAQKINTYIFVSAHLNKPVCYVGEPLLLTYELYSALKSTSVVQELPAFDKFLIIDMEVNNEFPRVVKKDGHMFNVFTIKQLQLIPDQAGEVTLGSISVNNTVTYTKNDKQYSYGGVVTSKPFKLMVKPLPANGQPANFNGNVGIFKITVAVAADTFPAGENNKLEIEVSGDGNFYSIKAPVVNWPSTFHSFDAAERSSVDKKSFPARGSHIISIPFVADEPGDFMIPPIELAFFDPTKGNYFKAVSPTIHLKVTPATGKNGITQSSGNKNKIADRGKWLFAGIGLLLLIGLLFFIVRYKKNEARKKTILLEDTRKKTEAAELRNNKMQVVYSNIALLQTRAPGDNYIVKLKEVLLAYLQQKLNMPGILLGEAMQELKAADSTIGESLQLLMNDCDGLLYSAIDIQEETRDLLFNRLDAIVKKIDQLS